MDSSKGFVLLESRRISFWRRARLIREIGCMYANIMKYVWRRAFDLAFLLSISKAKWKNGAGTTFNSFHYFSWNFCREREIVITQTCLSLDYRAQTFCCRLGSQLCGREGLGNDQSFPLRLLSADDKGKNMTLKHCERVLISSAIKVTMETRWIAA